MINKLFGYGTSLPTLHTKAGEVKLSDNAASFLSVHSDGTLPQSKIPPTLVAIINAIEDGNLALGYFMDGAYRNGVAEYTTSEGNIQVVVLNSMTGEYTATVITDEGSEAFVAAPSDSFSGLAIFAATIPAMLDTKYDKEFATTWDKMMAEVHSSTPNADVINESLHLLGHAFFCRTNNTKLDKGVYVQTNAVNGEYKQIKPAAIKAGTINPTEVLYGTFEVLEATSASSAEGATSTSTKKTKVSAADFCGSYAYGEAVPEDMKDLVPTLDDTVVISPLVHDICNVISKTSTIRNIGLVGPAGTGKTMTALSVAAGTGKPHFVKTCSANDEVTDFTGLLMPVTENMSTSDMTSAEKSLITDICDLGGISKKNFCTALGLPSVEDMFFDTEGAYEELTGKPFEGLDKHEAIVTWQNELESRIAQFIKTVENNSPNGNGGNKFKFVESPLIKALKFGGVCELQEPNVIIQPGVLVGLNSLMETSGTIQLPTGEKIVRHPDAVVILTTNGNYEGCREMNQSVKSRLHLVYRVDQPTVEVMAARVAAKTGFSDETALQEMAQIVVDISESMNELGITDGSCGPRELENWAVVAQVTGDIYTAGINCVISKVSDDPEAQDTCLKRLAESSFAPKRRKRKI